MDNLNGGSKGVKLSQALKDYLAHLKSFSSNARLYLVNVVIIGAAMGVFRLLFNFYILSLGYDQALLGKYVTVSSLSALVLALPAGFLADQLGRKISLLGAGVSLGVSIAGMVVWPQVGTLYLMNALFGFSQSLAAVTMAPFLMENSGTSERTYLFSFSSGLQMASASLGSWIGGYLPSWIANFKEVDATASSAYSGSMVVVAMMALVGSSPLLLLRRNKLGASDQSIFTPFSYAREHPAKLAKLILPLLLTSIGAGLIMPFMNVFFRVVYQQPDPVIGSLFAWGSLAMGIGLLVAPLLADRMGKIQMVVLTQALSIPFLILLGFSPWFWMAACAYYIRLALMNMSTPVYQTFVMENTEATARATVASLVSMSWNFGWAFSPMISGWLQLKYGFDPAFLGTIILYSISIVLYWSFFLRSDQETSPTPMPAD